MLKTTPREFTDRNDSVTKPIRECSRIYMFEEFVGSLTMDDNGDLSWVYSERWMRSVTSKIDSKFAPFLDVTVREHHGEHVNAFFDRELPEGLNLSNTLQRYGLPSTDHSPKSKRLLLFITSNMNGLQIKP